MNRTVIARNDSPTADAPASAPGWRPADLIQRVVFVAAVPQRLLLHKAADLVEHHVAEPPDMELVHDDLRRLQTIDKGVRGGPSSAAEIPPSRGPTGTPCHVATRDSTLVGYCYASHHRERPTYRLSMDCSVYLIESERGKGTGRALHESLLRRLRVLGYLNAFAGIMLPNDASVGLHKALGFMPVGVLPNVGLKRGVWRDVEWLQLPLPEPPQQPSHPAPWPDDDRQADLTPPIARGLQRSCATPVSCKA